MPKKKFLIIKNHLGERKRNHQAKIRKILIKEKVLITKEKVHLIRKIRVKRMHGEIKRMQKLKTKELTSSHDY